MDGHRFIEEQNAEEKEALRKKTEEKLGFSFSREASSSKKPEKVQRYFTAFATAFCALCLIIALPFIVKNITLPSSNGALNSGGKLNSAYDYSRQESDCNIKEYNLRHGTSLLYIDLYDIAEEVNTYVYLSEKDKSVLYFCETIFSRESFSEIDLYIVGESTQFESFKWRAEIAESQNGTVVAGVPVYWFGTQNAGTVVFSYSGYKYFVEISEAIGEEDAISIVGSMLKKEAA